MTKTNEVVKTEITQAWLDQYDNTSKKVRALIAEGYKVAEIEKIFIKHNVLRKDGGQIRYQMIRNISITPIATK